MKDKFYAYALTIFSLVLFFSTHTIKVENNIPSINVQCVGGAK